MNKRFTGQILRIVGLAIEMLGILAAALSGGQGNGGPGTAAGLSFRQICVIVGAGFVLWLVGTLLTYWPGQGRTGQKHVPQGKNDLEL